MAVATSAEAAEAAEGTGVPLEILETAPVRKGGHGHESTLSVGVTPLNVEELHLKEQNTFRRWTGIQTLYLTALLFRHNVSRRMTAVLYGTGKTAEGK